MNRKASAYEYSSADLAGRPVVEGVTIDDVTTMDMDDGIWIERRENGWRVLVSIADVSASIAPNSPLDLKARAQGFTIYNHDNPLKHKPMLTHDMDSDRLSLREGVLRPAVTVEALLDDNFNIVDSTIYRSAFFSRKKLSYEQFLELSGDPHHRFFVWAQFADGMTAKRRREGALTFDDLSKGLYLDDEGRLCSFLGDRHHGHAVVEETALLGNRIAADFMRTNNIPALYRNHAADAVDPETGPRVIHSLREAIASDDKADYKTAIRRLRLWFLRARYETDVKGHFGLAMPAYTHFTSPIRRYADLAVHRNLIAFIEGRPCPHSTQELAAIGAHLNARNDEERNYHQSETYKEILYRRMQRRVRSRSAVFNDLHDEELRMALFVAHYERIENRHLATEVTRRADKKQLGGLVCDYLLGDVQSRTQYWRRLKDAVAHQEDNPGLVRTFARSALDWVPAAGKLAALTGAAPAQRWLPA